MTQTLLIHNARGIATFDDTDPNQARELRDASLLVQGNRIAAIGPAAELPQSADTVIDARGHLVMPGLVNGRRAGTVRQPASRVYGGERAGRGAPGATADGRTRATNDAAQHFGATSGVVSRWNG